MTLKCAEIPADTGQVSGLLLKTTTIVVLELELIFMAAYQF